MKIKEKKLLEYIGMQDSWISSAKLAEHFSISKRTVKSYISALNSTEANLILSSNKGYRLNKEKQEIWQQESNSNVPETPAERFAFLLLTLVNSGEKQDIYELAESCFVSEPTIRSDLKHLKRIAAKHDLSLTISKEMVHLAGTEKNKRKLTREILMTELEHNFLSISQSQYDYQNVDLDTIREIVAEVFANRQYFTNDYALTNIVIHLAIAVDRIKRNFFFNPAFQSMAIDSLMITLAEEIAERLEKIYKINYSQAEIKELAILIAANGTNINFTQVSYEELERITDQHCLSLVQHIIARLNNMYLINFDDHDFLVRFTLHIKNMLNRLEKNIEIQNPMVNTIRKESPLIYDCAVQASIVVKEQTGFVINDDEIAYIAFHLGYALEQKKEQQEKINCTLLVPHYYNMNAIIMNKIQDVFSGDLEITNILTNEKELQNISTDLLVTAVELQTIPEVPYIVVNPFFTSKDREALVKKIFSIKQEKENTAQEKMFRSIISPENFLITEEINSQEKALGYICSRLIEKNAVPQGFFSDVLAREQLSSTAYGSIAIPHSLNMEGNRSGIFVLINPNGITWGKDVVKMVLLIFISSKDKNLFQEVFDNVATIFSEKGNIAKAVGTKNFEEFINILG